MPITPERVRWSETTREEFDEIVETLIVRKYSLDQLRQVRVIDGRGGDGGHDIDVMRGDIFEIIFQIKHFTSGIAGDRSKTRKQQIKKSFDVAMKDNPEQWILVVPCRLTQRDREWVCALPGENQEVSIHVWDIPNLNVELAAFPEVQQLFTRKQIVEAAKEMGMENEALVSPDSLSSRVGALQKRANSRSPYWGVRFDSDESGITETVYPKHPKAGEREPIKVNAQIDISALDSETLDGYMAQINYGASGTTIFPSQAIRSIDISGPEWIAKTISNVKMTRQVLSTHDVGTTSELRFENESGEVKRTLRGEISHTASGKKGFSLEIQFMGGLAAYFQFPVDVAEQGTVKLNFEPVGELPSPLHDVLSAVDLIHQGFPIQVFLNEELLMKIQTRPSSTIISLPNDLRDLAEDLKTIVDNTGIAIPFPSAVLLSERIDIRIASQILSGKFPLLRKTRFGVQIAENKSDEAHLLLDGSSPVLFELKEFEANFLNYRLQLGPVHIYCPSAQIDNPKELRDAIERDEAVGLALGIIPTDNYGFVAFKMDCIPNKDTAITPTPWGLSDIQEHPFFVKEIMVD